MNRKIKNITLLAIVMLLALNAVAHADAVLSTQFFKTIAISKVEHYDGKLVQNNLVIQPYAFKHDLSKSLLTEALSPQPNYGKPIWIITPQQLPVTQDTCISADATLCREYKNDDWRRECIHSCISGGAELLAYDNKAGKLFLYAASTALGTGGGPYFLFSADINKKEVTFLKIEYGPFDGDLSPDGKTLLLYGWNCIMMYDTLTGKEFGIAEENNWDRGHERLHYMYNIHWLSNTRFSYRIGVRHSKFQPSFDEMKENVYDLPSRKIMSTRTLAKTEYDSSPYTEMD